MEPPEDEPEAAPPGEGDGETAARGPSRQRGLRAALASLPVPEPGPSFWADIERALAEQPPLAISARPAIRPITQPPPLSQPSLDDLGTTAILITDDSVIDDDDLGGPPRIIDDSAGPDPDHDGADRGRDDHDDRGEQNDRRQPPRFDGYGEKSNTKTVVLVATVVVAAVLIAGSALGRGGGDDPSGADVTSTAPGGQPTTTGQATTAPAVPGLDPAAKLSAQGLGPLTIGTSLGDLADQGIKGTVDEGTFETSGGECYDVRLQGAPDLTLRFRSPDEGEGVEDPQDGELAVIAVTGPGSTRLTDLDLHLGSTEDQVRASFGGNGDVIDHPNQPGGHLFIQEADDSELGVAYGTNGQLVTEMMVGYTRAITQRQACR
jgi:hypothetical protein